MENQKRIEPIVLVNADGDDEYTLEFSRSSVMYAEKHGFTMEAIQNGQYLNGMSDLFFYAFRMHHPMLTHADTDRILFEELGGMPDGMAERLGELFAEPYNALIQNEGSSKNSKWTVKF